MRKTLACILTAALLCGSLCSCSRATLTDAAQSVREQLSEGEMWEAAEPADHVDFAQNSGDMFTDRDLRADYDTQHSVHIRLDGSSATADSDSVRIEGSTVTVTEEATYIITGTLDDGMLIVNAPEDAKLQLVLAGAHIHSSTSAALYILGADKVFLTLADGTENALSSGESYTAIDESNIDGALFSKQDLTVNGTGALTVTAPAGHGIVCGDDLVLAGGTCTVLAAAHGLDVNDSVRITGATALHIDAGRDGIHCAHDDDAALGFVYVVGGTLDIEAEGDGISASAYAHIDGGDFSLLTGGGSQNGTKASSDSYGGFMGGRPGGHRGASGSTATAETDDSTSMKGIKAAGGLSIGGGTFVIDAADDAIHSDASITLGGGTFDLTTGDDGVHAEDTLTVIDGSILIRESYEGLEALHLDIRGGSITLTADDDGLNAAGGTDGSGMSGGRDGMFGGGAPAKPSGSGGMPHGGGEGTIVISGGTLYICASGDGIDANGTLSITGGHTTVVGPTRGDTSTLDYDVSATITGGTFIGTGGGGMAQTFSDAAQGLLSVNVGNVQAGTTVTLQDADGNTLLSYTPALSYAVVIISMPELVSGESYTLTVGTQSKQLTAS